MEIETYRKIRNEIKELEEALTALNQERQRLENEVFADLKIGDSEAYGEFKFSVKEGRRSLSPRAGFEQDWEAEIVGKCQDPSQADRLQRMVTKKTVFKGPTLGELEKELPKNDHLRENYDTAKTILGYSEGGRREVVEVVETGDQGEIPGHFCYSKIAGTTHRQIDWATLSNGDTLDLIREPDNPYGREAIKVLKGETHLGYIKADLAREISPIIDQGTKMKARITAITGGGDLPNHGINIEIYTE